MENLVYSLNASLPIFLVMAAGWGLKRIGLLNESFAASADKLVFRVTVPLLLFNQIRACLLYTSRSQRPTRNFPAPMCSGAR